MTAGTADRSTWLSLLARLADPVLTALAQRRLRAGMPLEKRPNAPDGRAAVAHLETVGRLLAGIAPWLESGGGSPEEQAARARLRKLAQESIAAAVDPGSPDYCNFTTGSQPLVDGAFLAHAVLRAPTALYRDLPAHTQTQLLDAFEQTRRIRPGFCNWLLFSAIIEAALHRCGRWFDAVRVDYAVRQHEQWYKGDGHYGDGPAFHWDYYNSYVIQPMLLDTLAAFPPETYPGGGHPSDSADARPRVLARAQRYAVVLERLIAPDGTFPVIGRSIVYRAGAFQLLAQLALQHRLPAELPPGQVRTALTAVLRRTLEVLGTFNEQGFLTVGLSGHQPSLGEAYISSGSLYLTATALLPLGLPPEDPFWSVPAQPCTQQRAWSGQDLPADHAH